MAFDVFISHSSKDKLTADAVCAVLESRSIRCWIAPRDIQPGADWGESIIEAIKACRIMVLVFSRNANESVQIKRELDRAVHHGKSIIPLRIEDVMPTGALEYSISTAHWLDAFTPPLERHLNYLADTVEAILAGKPQPLPPPKPVPPSPSRWFIPGIAAAVVAAVGLALFLTRHASPPSPVPSPSPSSSSTPSSSSPSLFSSSPSPSIQGRWTLAGSGVPAPGKSAFAELIRDALGSPNVSGKLEVKALNEYTFTITATDPGKVTPAGSDGDYKTLAFTSDSTQKPVTISYFLTDNSNGAYDTLNIPSGEKVIMFGMNLGSNIAIVHGNPDGSGDSGSLESGLVGTWAGTPFNVNPPNGLWSGTMAIHADGTYLLTVAHEESGILSASDGSWSAKPSTSGSGAPGPSIFNDAGASATYALSGSDTLQIGTTNGTLTFKRGW